MAILMLALIIYMIYVSYCKIVFLLFKGKQYNRFFATFLNTFMPVVGSIPVVVMASKYERRVNNVASRMNEDILRYCIIGMELLSVFLLFCPFFTADEASSAGINLFVGNEIAGSDMMKPAMFMIYLVIVPFIASVLTIADRKYNIHNIFSYITSLLICLSLLAILLVFSTEEISATIFFWIHCFLNVTVMLLSVFSIVIVRNASLQHIEQIEKDEYIRDQKKKNRRVEVAKLTSDTYKCAKCGSVVKKGEVCSCIENRHSLNRIMQKNDSASPSSKFCIYCKKELKEGEVCDCAGSGFGIAVKSQPYVGRKCKYCGQQLIGESTCVCEKILRNSQPLSSDIPKPLSDEKPYEIEDSTEKMNELENKINKKFSDMKNLSDE